MSINHRDRVALQLWKLHRIKIFLFKPERLIEGIKEKETQKILGDKR